MAEWSDLFEMIGIVVVVGASITLTVRFCERIGRANYWAKLKRQDKKEIGDKANRRE